MSFLWVLTVYYSVSTEVPLTHAALLTHLCLHHNKPPTTTSIQFSIVFPFQNNTQHAVFLDWPFHLVISFQSSVALLHDLVTHLPRLLKTDSFLKLFTDYCFPSLSSYPFFPTSLQIWTYSLFFFFGLSLEMNRLLIDNSKIKHKPSHLHWTRQTNRRQRARY